MKLLEKGLALAACAAVSLAGSRAVAAEGAHWTYEGAHGPSHWGEMDKEFEACKLGKLQSPIDITAAKKAPLPAIAFRYASTPATVVDNGHTVQVKVAPGSSIAVGEKKFELVQFHFHRPSEERVRGKASAMDAHLVHRSADGKLAVVAVLLEPGAANELVGAIWKSVPAGHRESAPGALSVDPARLLPASHGYYTFTGSLTTPPCSEGVTWLVLRSPVQVSSEQVASFAKRYPDNARPVQPVGERVVEESE